MSEVLKKMMDELAKMELRDKIATDFIKRVVKEGSGFFAKTAEKTLIAMDNNGNSSKEEE